MKIFEFWNVILKILQESSRIPCNPVGFPGKYSIEFSDKFRVEPELWIYESHTAMDNFFSNLDSILEII